MAADKNVVCASCGFAKNPPGSVRCVSCGAKIEALGRVARSKEEEEQFRYQQEGLNVAWLGISIGVQGVLTAAIVFGLPMVITALDFEGGNGMAVCVPVWFFGGMLVGMISPGRTFVEPRIAAAVIAIPTTYLLQRSETVHTMPGFLYWIMAAIGVLFSTIGAYVGERIQMGPPPKAVE
jgi:hypothetical protein